MSKNKQELLLIIAAAAIFVSVLLYNVFDSPKYSAIESVSVPAITHTPTTLPQGKVNINTASAAELTTLYGIGEARAKAIIEYRQRNGRFISVEELTNIQGINQSVIEKNADRIIL